MKKGVFIISILILTLLFPPAALAHGHGRTAARSYSLCSEENCDISCTHRHADTWYGGHYIGDGHDYHNVCNVAGCAYTTNHKHDGVTCFPHFSGDGHGYHTTGSRGHGGKHH